MLFPGYFTDRAKKFLELAKRVRNPELAGTLARLARLLTQAAMEAERSLGLRFQVETALRESEQQLRWLASIVESSHDAIISTDPRGIITTWNNGAERLYGYTPGEVIGRPIKILVPPDCLGEDRSILERLERGERIEDYETVRQRKDGSLVDVSLTISPVKNAEGNIIGASAIIRNITARKHAEAREKMLMAELDHRVKNVLARMDMVLMSSRNGSSSIDEFARTVKGRIQSMAAAHTLLSQNGWNGVGLEALDLLECLAAAGRVELPAASPELVGVRFVAFPSDPELGRRIKDVFACRLPGLSGRAGLHGGGRRRAGSSRVS